MYWGLLDIPEVLSCQEVTYDNLPDKSETLSDDTIKVMKQRRDVFLLSIMYKSDDLKIHGYIFGKKLSKGKISEKKISKVKRPVVIYLRGGNNHPVEKNQNDIKVRWFYSSEFEFLELLDAGYLVFATNYRGSKLSCGVDEFGGKDINDVINLYPIIRKWSLADENCINLLGDSRGGMMALLTATRVKWVKRIAIAGAALDLANMPFFDHYFRKYFGMTNKIMRQRSVKGYVKNLPKIPILILHGGLDKRVPMVNILDAVQILQRHEIPYKLVLVHDGNHVLGNYPEIHKREVLEWFMKDITSK